MKKIALTLALSTFGFASMASAQLVNAAKIAASNATIETGGDSGAPFFHNAQVPGGFESYAISSYDFTAADFGVGALTSISAVRIAYMQSNAFFTTDGSVEFFVSFDTTVGGGDYSGLAHNSTGSGIADSEFSDAPSTQSLGTGTFTETASGDVDTYTLNFGGSLETQLVSAINSGNAFSILLTAPTGSTAATYAGIESNNYVINGGSEPDDKRTTLTIAAVPEPSAYALLVGLLGLSTVLVRRRY